MERTIKFASLRAPDARDLGGMKGWIKVHGAVSGEEGGHLLGGTDFVALVEKQEEGWLDNIVERALSRWWPRAVGAFSILASYGFPHSARESSFRRSNVASAIIRGSVYAARTALTS